MHRHARRGCFALIFTEGMGRLGIVFRLTLRKHGCSPNPLPDPTNRGWAVAIKPSGGESDEDDERDDHNDTKMEI